MEGTLARSVPPEPPGLPPHTAPPHPRALSMVLAPPCPRDLACLYTSLRQYLDFIPLIITTPVYLTTATALVCSLQAE